MLTRIPQPEMWGPSPAESQAQAADYGTRVAAMFAQGIAEGQRNYVANKQAQSIEKYRQDTLKQNAADKATAQQDAMTSLRMKVLAQQLDDGLKAAGPGNEAKFFLDNQSTYKQFYKLMANGDNDLAQEMLQGTAKVLNNISPMSAYRMGLIGSPQGANGAPGQAAAAGFPPSQQGAAGAPLGAGQAPMSPASAAPPQGMPFGQAGAPVAPGQAGTPLQPSTSTVSPTSQAFPQEGSISITQMSKGIQQNAVTKSADAGLQKIASIAMGNVEGAQNLTPKEQAAIKTTIKPTVQVLRDSEIFKEFKAAGGSDEALQKAADQLNTALQDPTFAKYLQTANVLNDKEQAAVDRDVANDTKMQAAVEKARHDMEIENKANLAIATKAFQLREQFQLGYQRLQVQMANAKDKKTRDMLADSNKAAQLAISSLNTFDRAADALRAQFSKDHKGASDDEINNFINQQLADPNSPAGASLGVAAQLVGAWMGTDPKETTVQLKSQYLLGIPFLPETSPAQQFQVPAIPSPLTAQPRTAPAAPARQAAPQAATPGVSRKMTPEELIQASGGQ
jgi:hypothetical protein